MTYTIVDTVNNTYEHPQGSPLLIVQKSDFSIIMYPMEVGISL